MAKLKCRILYVVVVLMLNGFALAEEISRGAAPELMQECQGQREENIAPLREQAIEDCVTNRRRDREYCESYNRTFGERRAIGGGRTVPGMFWGLPVCEKALAAERYFRMNPRSPVYSLP